MDVNPGKRRHLQFCSYRLFQCSVAGPDVFCRDLSGSDIRQDQECSIQLDLTRSAGLHDLYRRIRAAFLAGYAGLYKVGLSPLRLIPQEKNDCYIQGGKCCI